MATFQPADNLRSRTFFGLLVAQFLAAFNDQAIHASSMFFAINQNALSKDFAISLMPILFYAPWALFCTLAGYLADRYSKWNSLVFWKVAEIGITLIALLGFWLGTHGIAVGPYLVLSTVFLMGTHSAFFVPAKYGAMPEILQPQMLSRGNGVLESLSFLAVILGTVMGGVLSQVFRGQEYWIGVILVTLAVIGALASLSFVVCRRPTRIGPSRRTCINLCGKVFARCCVRGRWPWRSSASPSSPSSSPSCARPCTCTGKRACRRGTRPRPAKSSAWSPSASAWAVRSSASSPAARSNWA